MRYYTIYKLVDPRYPVDDPRSIRYIGRTSIKLSARLSSHLTNWWEDGGPRSEWFQEMLHAEMRPDIVAIEKVDSAAEAKERERHWIHHYESLGFELTNVQMSSLGSRVWDRQRVIEDFQIEVMRLLLGQDSPYSIALRNLEVNGQKGGALYLYLQAAETPDISLEEIPDLFRECDKRVKGLEHEVIRAIGSGDIREPIASALVEAIEESKLSVTEEEGSVLERYMRMAEQQGDESLVSYPDAEEKGLQVAVSAEEQS